MKLWKMKKGEVGSRYEIAILNLTNRVEEKLHSETPGHSYKIIKSPSYQLLNSIIRTRGRKDFG